ncbi:MAG: Gfo/Idh/MocA family oxidoreductase [Chthoniobacterales bacterium]|nr:Gfo/Idh/MocA family oxidoreductase [Chthoniobacterales bacterium]MCX7713834.1 Gfo/Idh/MocA family oxidoreductase [Chthoniobacterales bacterium]
MRVGVVGVGHIGANHARIYADLPNCELVAVYDINTDIATSVAKKYKTRVASSLDEFASLAQAASVATPTTTHYEIGSFLLKKGLHLLIEKPLAHSSAAAHSLAELATANGRILQVGHVERFNPAFTALENKINNPRFIEVTRISPYPERSTDIGVVLDLMIHDLEILLHIVRSPVKSLDPVGISVLSPSEDIANVRIHFENGCIANVTASRVSADRIRKIRVFQQDTYLSLDYQNQTGVIVRLEQGKIVRSKVEVEKGEPLRNELAAFIECAREGKQPRVSGQEAAAALDLALEISRQIAANDPRQKAK